MNAGAWITLLAWLIFAPLYVRAAWRERNQDSPNGETARRGPAQELRKRGRTNV